MPVTSTKLISDTLQRDGRRLVLYEFTDHLGVARLGSSKMMPADFDPSLDAAFEAGRHDAALARMEESQVSVAPDVLAYINAPQHSNKRAISRKLVRYMMRESDPQELRKFAPFIQYLKDNFNASQVRNYLDITPFQLGQMNKKFNAILAAEVNLKDISDASEVIK